MTDRSALMRSLLVIRWFVVSRDSTFLPMACKDVNERHHIRIRGTNCYGMTHFRAAISIELPVDPFPPAPIAIRGSVRVPVKPYAALSNTTRVRSTKHNRRCRHARITPRRKSTRPQTKPPATSPRRCVGLLKLPKVFDAPSVALLGAGLPLPPPLAPSAAARTEACCRRPRCPRRRHRQPPCRQQKQMPTSPPPPCPVRSRR